MKIKKGGYSNIKTEDWLLLFLVIIGIVGITTLAILFPHPGGVPI